MRLSEDRIHSIANKIAFQLVKKRMVTSKRNLMQITAWVEAHFTAKTVGGVTVYDLSTGASS